MAQLLKLTKRKLSDVPSELIMQALDDLAICESQPDKFKIDMGVWVSKEDVCHVCFAGAVMACGRPSITRELSYFPDDFEQDLQDKFVALNYFRIGHISDGLRRMGFGTPDGMPLGISPVAYRTSKRGFRRDMKALAKLLKKNGL